MSQPLKSLAPAFVRIIEIDYVPPLAGSGGNDSSSTDSSSTDSSSIVITCPMIDIEPSGQTVTDGDPAEFVVVLSEVGGVSYQWQVSSDGGFVWDDLAESSPYSGTTTDTLSIDPTDVSMSGYLYRCIISKLGCLTLSTTPAELTVDAPSLIADVLLVGGGGGGVPQHNGVPIGTCGPGGGGGGMREISVTLSEANTYTVTVGAGGAFGAPGANASNGGSSSIEGIDLPIETALGGGGGGVSNGVAGGSGGGASGTAANYTGGAGTPGQGHNGGNGFTGGTYDASGGGGGAATAGQAGVANVRSGNGGDGLQSTINGSYYGGGGGGGFAGATLATGGVGGGGNGSNSSTNGTSGSPNTGGGGGGGGYNGRTPGSGGSGIVVVKYAGTPVFTGGTVTEAGGFTYHTFTSSGSLAPI